MTLPVDPVKVASAVARHVRNSHAIGKLVVDTALRGISAKSQRNSSAESQPPTTPTHDSAPDDHLADQATNYEGLPLPVAQWALLSSGDVVDMIDRCDDAAVRAIGAFEESHRRRRLVVQAVKNRLAE